MPPSHSEHPQAAPANTARPEVLIRQATRHDREALWEFMKVAYEEDSPGVVRYKVPLRWNWQFIDNPYIEEKDGKLPIWIALMGEKIVGQMCALPMRITIDGRTYNGGWGCDFIVLKEYRGHGIGWRLNKTYCDHYPIVVHVTQAGGTERMWEKYGSVPLTPVSIMWKIFNIDGRFVFRYLNGKTKSHPPLNRLFKALCRYFFLHGFISFGVNMIMMLQGAFRPPFKASPRSEISEITEFDAEFADFIDAASAGYDALVKRDPRFLGWKYIGNPVVPYRLFVLKREGMIKGHIVLRRAHPAELNIGVIADIFTGRGDEEASEALVSHAIAYLGDSVNVIQVLVSSKLIARVLRKHGFFKMRTYVPHFICSDPELRQRLKQHTREWFITFADHDQEQVRPAE